MKRLILATRGSALAMVQARAVAAALSAKHPDLGVELKTFRSEGDQRADVSLSSAGGQGLFTRVLEEALLKGEADAAVHSLKDLPTELPPKLGLAAVGEREDWRDAWLAPVHAAPFALPQGSLVGTGSPRRRAQLAVRRPDLRFAELRGNVDTRLRKIADGEVDGAVLALAGLRRLGLEAHARHVFSEDELLPAPGQGFIAVESLSGGEAFVLCREAFNHGRSEAEAVCERAFLARLRAGCMAPVGALARVRGEEMTLNAFAALDPARPLRRALAGPVRDPAGLAERLADSLLSKEA